MSQQHLERARDEFFRQIFPRVNAASCRGVAQHREAVNAAQQLLATERRAVIALPRGSQEREFRADAITAVENFLASEEAKVVRQEERQALYGDRMREEGDNAF